MPLGQLVGALGRFSAGSGRFAGAFGLPGPPRVSILKGLGTCRARFWKAPGACFSMLFAAPRTSLHNAFIHALNHSLAFTLAFLFSPAARRYVHSTSAASRRDAERARYKVQVPSLASKAFLSLKSLAFKAYPKVRLEIEAEAGFPPS